MLQYIFTCVSLDLLVFRVSNLCFGYFGVIKSNIVRVIPKVISILFKFYMFSSNFAGGGCREID